MECNKDEAVRARDISLKKLEAKDIDGAKKFALKAQALYSGLEGLPQLLTMLDVYVSAEKKVNSEIDWYRVLGVDPLADDDTIRKNYRKLALTLHPDKNKLIGADGAFKILSEAWSLLSDKAKRTAYDQKRNIKASHQNVSANKTSMPASRNGFHNFSTASRMNVNSQRSTTCPKPPPPIPRPPRPKTFWTVCNRCKMQYEYLINYLNHTLLCPNCHEPFLAVETPPPPQNGRKSSTPWGMYQQRQIPTPSPGNKNPVVTGVRPPVDPSDKARACYSDHTSVRSDSVKFSGNVQGVSSIPSSLAATATVSSSFSAQIPPVMNPSSEKFKVSYEEHLHAKKRPRADEFGAPPSAKTQVLPSGTTTPSTTGNAFTHHKSFEAMPAFNFMSMNKPAVSREPTQREMRDMLMEKAKNEIKKKLNEWKQASETKADERKEKCTDDHIKVDTSKDECEAVTEDNSSNAEAFAMNVPDPDFHDFDKDRNESSFEDNQIWAAYDDDDGMPRYYAMIRSIISLKPFKMRISWLTSKSNIELAPINWVACGFAKTNGDFRIGRHEIYSSLNSFSHRVKFVKGARGVIQIFPRKGDVWAMYRNWSPDWNELTPDEVIHKYDMVEVVEDYEEKEGARVAPLVKVAGFRTVFHRHLDPNKAYSVPKEEIFRFSHQVPSCLLTGQEGQNAPKGCRELDPAATPLELLAVVAEGNEGDTAENADKLNAVADAGEATECDVTMD